MNEELKSDKFKDEAELRLHAVLVTLSSRSDCKLPFDFVSTTSNLQDLQPIYLTSYSPVMTTPLLRLMGVGVPDSQSYNGVDDFLAKRKSEELSDATKQQQQQKRSEDLGPFSEYASGLFRSMIFEATIANA